MSLPAFDIIDVRDWEALQRELRGNRTKVWVRDPVGGAEWLRKEPDPARPFQAVTEIIALSIANNIGVVAPEGHLCRWVEEGEEKTGVIVRSFLSDGDESAQGEDELGGVDEQYDPNFRPSHTLGRVRGALLQLAEARGVTAASLLCPFAAILTLDAWLGIQDRHPANWGTIYNKDSVRLAPFYDGAACLGSELNEASLAKKAAKVANYVAACPSGFGDGKGLITQKVAFHQLATEWPETTETVRSLTKSIREFSDTKLIQYFSSVPEVLLPPSRVEFLLTVLKLRLEFIEGEVGK